MQKTWQEIRTEYDNEYVRIQSLTQFGMHLYTFTARIHVDPMFIFYVYEPDMRKLKKLQPDAAWSKTSINDLNIEVLLKWDEHKGAYRINWDGMKEVPQAELITEIVQETKTVETEAIEFKPLTPAEQVARLRARFTPEEHEIREGNKSGTRQRWFVYVRREAIETRLDELFPMEWSNGYGEPEINAKFAVVSATLTIHGVTRSYNGGQRVKEYADAEMTEDTVKGAYTDAFKRVASMWGIGLYLQSSPQIWTNAFDKKDRAAREAAEKDAWAQFERWFVGQQKPQQAPAPKPSNVSDIRENMAQQHGPIGRDEKPATNGNGAWKPTTQEIQDIAKRIKPYGISSVELVLKHAGKTMVSDFGTADALVNYAHEHMDAIKGKKTA